MKKPIFGLCLLCICHIGCHPFSSAAQNTAGKMQFKNQTIKIKDVSFTMVAVQGGSYIMGATSEQAAEAYEDESPVHKVTLSDYYIGCCEVTQALWTAVMGNNPSFFKDPERPVECVGWNDCQKFIAKLNQITGKKFRLPTEAEWEFAARGGLQSKNGKYAGSDLIDKVAWYNEDWDTGTHKVASKDANELGLYDMSGNIYEWCQDWFGRYEEGDQTNPQGPPTGKNRVLRGGSWFVIGNYCRISNRSGSLPDSRFIHIGFRLAMSAE